MYCTTWAVCVCAVLVPCVRVRCGLYHMGCVFLCCTRPMRESPLRTVPHGLCVSVLYSYRVHVCTERGITVSMFVGLTMPSSHRLRNSTEPRLRVNDPVFVVSGPCVMCLNRNFTDSFVTGELQTNSTCLNLCHRKGIPIP